MLHAYYRSHGATAVCVNCIDCVKV